MSLRKLSRRTYLFTLLLCAATLAATFTSAAREDGRPKLAVQNGHTRGLSDVAYSPDGSVVATAEGSEVLWTRGGGLSERI